MDKFARSPRRGRDRDEIHSGPLHKAAAPAATDAHSRLIMELRIVLAALIAYILFATHWVRDSIGALELPLEAKGDGFQLTPAKYNRLATAYFLPNCIMPIIGGVLATRGNPARVYVNFLRIFFLGCVLVAASALIAHELEGKPHSDVPYALLLMGRLLMGISYEATDMIGPLSFLQPRFADSWSTLVSIINGVNRIGSVLNFLVEPLLHSAFGLREALIVPSVIGASTLMVGTIARAVHKRAPLPMANGPGQVEAVPQEHLAAADEASGMEGAVSSRASDEGTDTVNDEAAEVGLPDEAADDAAGGEAGGDGQPSGMDEVTKDAPLADGRVDAAFAATFGVTLRQVREGLGLHWWLFLAGSACTYGAVVPFWFIGAKHVALAWEYSLSDADALLLFPEGLIALVGPPLGCAVDRFQWGTALRLVVAAAALGGVSVAVLLLAWAPVQVVSPLPLVIALGFGYAVNQSLIWMTFPSLVPAPMLNLLGGLLGSSLNLAPALLPVLLLSGTDLSFDMLCLALVGLLGALLFAAAALHVHRHEPPRTPPSPVDAPLDATPDARGKRHASRLRNGQRGQRMLTRVKSSDRESMRTLVKSDSCAEAAAAMETS